MFYAPLGETPRNIELPRLPANELPLFTPVDERDFSWLRPLGGDDRRRLIPIRQNNNQVVTRDVTLGQLGIGLWGTTTGQPKLIADVENVERYKDIAASFSQDIDPEEIAIAASLYSSSNRLPRTIVAPLVGLAVVTSEVDSIQRVGLEPVISTIGDEPRFGLIEDGYYIRLQRYSTIDLRRILSPIGAQTQKTVKHQFQY